MPRIFINLEAGCLQVNLMSTSTQINKLKYTILYYTNRYMYTFYVLKILHPFPDIVYSLFQHRVINKQ